MESNKKNIYYIYHIFGKKIGVTRNLKFRVTQQQGYKPHEYEILEASSDIDYISAKERELQKEYNYEIDRNSYIDYKFNNSKNNFIMELNVTEQTTTFPCPVNKLKGQLTDNLGKSFSTPYGEYTLDHDLIEWIVENALISTYRDTRCFIYNKALAEAVTNNTLLKATPKKQYLKFNKLEEEKNQSTVFDKIRSWAEERGIYASGDVKTQYIKLQEESGELAKAILKKDTEEFVDAIGDMVVVLTNLATLHGFNIEDCIDHAYSVIEKRKGKMVNGTFVKNTL